MHFRTSQITFGTMIVGMAASLAMAAPQHQAPSEGGGSTPLLQKGRGHGPAAEQARYLERLRSHADGIRDRIREASPRGRIGIALGSVGEPLAAHLDVDPSETVLVAGVVDDGPAAAAGVQRFDIITHVDGNAPVGMATIHRIMAEKEPGDQITLGILRAGESLDVAITVQEAPDEPAAQRRLGMLVPELHELERIENALGAAAGIIRDRQPEIDRQLERLREQAQELRQSVETEWQALRELALNEQTQQQLREALEGAAERAAGALEQAASALESMELDVKVRAPRIEIRRRSGGGVGGVGGGGGMVGGGSGRGGGGMGGGGGFPALTERRIERIEERPDSERINARFERLEERLERMERMMRSLLERE